MRIRKIDTTFACIGIAVFALTGCGNSSGASQAKQDAKPTPLNAQQMAAMQKSIANDPAYLAAQRDRAARAGRIHPVLAPGATIPAAQPGK